MARKCKCWITKEEGTTDVFFKAPDGHYYKTEELYLECQRDKQYRKDTLNLIGELVGYSSTKKFPTVITKKLKELEVNYSRKIIYYTFLYCTDQLNWAVRNKRFQSDYGMCAYIMAIIANHIEEIDKKLKKEKANNSAVEIFENYDDLKVSTVRKPTHDISQFINGS